MPFSPPRQLLIACGLVAFLLTVNSLLVAQQSHVAKSKKNMVASVHPLATDAGVAAFEAGGNAIDAAIATALTLGVVDNFNSGIGGGCFILIRTADGKLFAIDGREMAPAAAHRDMFLKDGKPDSSLSQIGPLASGVPGALKAFEAAVKRHGKLRFSQLVRPAAKIAENGFIVDENYASRIRATAKHLAKFPGTKKVLLKPDGSPYRSGERLIQKDLANTYRQIADKGTDWFYNGDFAAQVGAWMKANGGIMTAKDFANYKTVDRKPVVTTYRGHKIIGFPPPSSGGVHVAQILNIVENFDLANYQKSDPNVMRHIVAEAMKLAFADRAYWLGDPDFAKVPRGLIDKQYAKKLAKKIDLNAASIVKSHGTPPRSDTEFFSRHTTHIAAADSAGNWVAITSTVNTTFGSKVIIPGLGVVMNNQMDDFSIAPGTPNAFGLVGAEANAVQPGKRPLSSMSPTIILKDDQPIMTVGAAGGPKIITQVLLATIRRIDFGMSIGDAIGRPRWHHQWSPNRLLIEKGNAKDTIEKLKSMGHKIYVSKSAGVCQGITYDPQTKTFTGAHDPRVPGKAAGQK